MPPYRKSSPDAPAGYFAWEAAGLRWLAAAVGGARVVEVLDVGPTQLDLTLLRSTAPTPAAAESFGSALARTHLAGAAAYGCPPAGWQGDGFFGPLEQPLPLALAAQPHWPGHLGANLIGPITRAGRDAGVFDRADAKLLERVVGRAGRFDTGEPPSRIHGDLWSGNLLWTSAGATLIDPAAHGGHREADLAMLALFGAPHLPVILAAYQQQAPLADGWHDRVALHQLYPVAVHAVIFGGGYAAQTLAIARRYG